MKAAGTAFRSGSAIFVAFCSLALVLGLADPVFAKQSATAPKGAADARGAVTIPAPPALPQTVSFAAAVAGRHLLCDTQEAYHVATNVAFTAHWTKASGVVGATVVANLSGVETVRGAASERKMSVATEVFGVGGEHEIRRAACKNAELVTTHFEQANTTAGPRRTWARLTLDEGADLQRALALVSLKLQTQAARFSLDGLSDIAPFDSVVWDAGNVALPGGGIGRYVEQAASRNFSAGTEPHPILGSFLRYLIEPGTHRLLRLEMWNVEGGNAHVLYRREDYSDVRLDSETVNSASWALPVIPKEYVEAAPPSVDLPPLRKLLAPDTYDPRALKLIERWRAAQQRYITIAAAIQVDFHNTPRTANSRPLQRRQQQDTTMTYEVYFRRPASAHITIQTLKGGGRRGGGGTGRFRQQGLPVNGTAVSDGNKVTWVSADDRRVADLSDPNAFYSTLVGSPLNVGDPYDALNYALNPPQQPEVYDRIGYGGKATIDGKPVEIVTLGSGAHGPRQSVEVTIQISLGADGLPRAIATKYVTDLSGRLERDQPPIQTVEVRFVKLATDAEMSSTLFAKL